MEKPPRRTGRHWNAGHALRHAVRRAIKQFARLLPSESVASASSSKQLISEDAGGTSSGGGGGFGGRLEAGSGGRVKNFRVDRLEF